MNQKPIENTTARTLVMATNNPHKLEEIRRMAGDSLRILSLEEIGCHADIPETAPDLAGNSLQKARFIKDNFGYDCFADDTGLMVDALNGAPGVYSARYAGPHCSPDDNIDLLLKKLEGITCRSARFATVITLIEGDKVSQFEGTVEGDIDTQRRGSGGFGYDPIFIPRESGISFALMSPEDKNRISHRGRATRKLFDHLNS